jgi:hypothetical protein
VEQDRKKRKSIFNEVITMAEIIDDTETITITLKMAATTGAAKGELRYVTYPTTAVHGANIPITCKVYNSGTATGTFKVRMTQGNLVVSTTAFSVASKNYGGIQRLTAKAPSSGSSTTITLQCRRIT